jgi:hypothetical protein
MKPNLKSLLKAKRQALAKADPKSRDRIRQRLRALEVAQLLRKKGRAA